MPERNKYICEICKRIKKEPLRCEVCGRVISSDKKINPDKGYWLIEEEKNKWRRYCYDCYERKRQNHDTG